MLSSKKRGCGPSAIWGHQSEEMSDNLGFNFKIYTLVTYIFRLKDKSVYQSIAGDLSWSYHVLSIILHSVLLRNKAQTCDR